MHVFSALILSLLLGFFLATTADSRAAVADDCEAALAWQPQTSFARLVVGAKAAGVITTPDLKAAANSTTPLSPLDGSSATVQNQAYKARLADLSARPETRKNWPKIREELNHFLHIIDAENNLRDDAAERTQAFLSPKQIFMESTNTSFNPLTLDQNGNLWVAYQAENAGYGAACITNPEIPRWGFPLPERISRAMGSRESLSVAAYGVAWQTQNHGPPTMRLLALQSAEYPTYTMSAALGETTSSHERGPMREQGNLRPLKSGNGFNILQWRGDLFSNKVSIFDVDQDKVRPVFGNLGPQSIWQGQDGEVHALVSKGKKLQILKRQERTWQLENSFDAGQSAVLQTASVFETKSGELLVAHAFGGAKKKLKVYMPFVSGAPSVEIEIGVPINLHPRLHQTPDGKIYLAVRVADAKGRNWWIYEVTDLKPRRIAVLPLDKSHDDFSSNGLPADWATAPDGEPIFIFYSVGEGIKINRPLVANKSFLNLPVFGLSRDALDSFPILRTSKQSYLSATSYDSAGNKKVFVYSLFREGSPEAAP